ncbi:Inorganic pyrophosphatase [Polyrhizophydium stewartii]|uniref:Inorganic pyrophosphatase n=1 Tax=Polyrhizophydium stewartii TaxID=2732419 RepID=A0ABR4MV09_9FUNG
MIDIASIVKIGGIALVVGIFVAIGVFNIRARSVPQRVPTTEEQLPAYEGPAQGTDAPIEMSSLGAVTLSVTDADAAPPPPPFTTQQRDGRFEDPELLHAVPPPSYEVASQAGSHPDAANQWDRMPAEIQGMILDAAGPFTKFTTGTLLLLELRGLPMRQHKQLWQDAIDADWQGDLGLLPWFEIASRSLRVPRSFLARHLLRFKHESIAMIAIRNGWTDMLDFGKPGELATAAAHESSLGLLRDLVDVRKVVEADCDLVSKAARSGHLGIVRFLRGRVDDDEWDHCVASAAGKSGNLDLIIWLNEHHPERVDQRVFEDAVHGNHTHIVRWLLNNTACRPKFWTLVDSAKVDNPEMLRLLWDHSRVAAFDATPMLVSSHIDMLEWLDEQGCVSRGSLAAHIVRSGKIGVLEWAMARFNLGLQELDLEYAYIERHTHVLKWAHERGVPFTSISANGACLYNYTEIMSWAISCDGGVIPMLLKATAKHGYSLHIEWWRVRHGAVLGQRELEMAIRECNDQLVQALLETHDVDWDLDGARDSLDDVAGPSKHYGTDGIRALIDAATSRYIVIHECHEAWRRLITKAIPAKADEYEIAVANTEVADSPYRVTSDDAQHAALPKSSPKPALPIDPSIDKWFFLSGQPNL